MSEGKQYIPDQFAGREFKAASVTQAKASTKLYKTSSSDPASTDDTGLGYAVGTIWTNTSSGQIFICTDASAEDAAWKGQEGDDINVFTVYGTGSAFQYGGYTPGNIETIEKFSYTAPAAAADSGELTVARRNCGMGQLKDKSYAYVAKGVIQGPGAVVNQVGRFPFAATYDEADVGEFVNDSWYCGTACDGTYGWVAGGTSPPTSVAIDNIEKVTFGSPAPTSDIGELSTTLEQVTGISDTVNSRAFFNSGYTYGPPATRVNNIQYIAFSHSSGGTTDWGDLQHIINAASSSMSPTDGIVVGGYAPAVPGGSDKIDKYSFSSPGNSSDSGELSTAVQSQGGNTSSTDFFTCGGSYPPAHTDSIQKGSLTAPHSSADYGELTETKHSPSGADGT